MSGFSPALAAHLRADVTTLATCWRLTRRDGTVMGFTDHDDSLIVDGTLFQPRSGFSASEVRETMGLAAGSGEVEGALSSDGIRPEDIAAGRFDGATVETLLVNWRQPAAFALIRRAIVGKITQSDHRFVAELQGFAQALDATVGRTLRRSCDAELGDGRCGFVLARAAYQAAGSVLDATADGTLTVAGLEGYTGGWFGHGTLLLTGGVNSGASARIDNHFTSVGETQLTLPADFAVLVAPGDAFLASAGCDKAFATCKAKFGNAVNFRGFPHLPGNDSGYAYVAEGGVFDGGPLVP